MRLWEGAPGTPPRPGALVVSLDFELMWGVQDIVLQNRAYTANIAGAREAIPRILDVFAKYEISATWATVGALFAESVEELMEYIPEPEPSYVDGSLRPFTRLTDLQPEDRSLYFAPDLIEEIAARPGQEIASHTFSHYYCLEPGQDISQFEADTRSMEAIAKAKGHEFSSIVFPRNQVNGQYLPVLARSGYTAYRGTEDHFFGKTHATSRETILHRGMRALDSVATITGSGAFDWESTTASNGLVNVRSSRFLRPASRRRAIHGLTSGRVLRGLEAAATGGMLYHIWWHPHNFGTNLQESLDMLSTVLSAYERLRDALGFESMSMRDVAERTGRSRTSLDSGLAGDQARD